MDSRRARYLEAIGIDRYVARTPAQAQVVAVGSSSVEPPAAPPARREPVVPSAAPSAPSVADETLSFADLAARVAGCQACALGATRTQAVFGVGSEQAELMIVGEAPGAEEDRRGEPFVGRAGQLLDEMLRAIGLARGDVFIANILKCRPPGNRDPMADEIAACQGYLRRQIEHVAPRLLLAVGRIAAQTLLEASEPLGRLRGRVHEHAAWPVPVFVTYHPAYLLRTPAQKARAWQDLKLVRQWLTNT